MSRVTKEVGMDQTRRCPRCQNVSPPMARFCARCGQPMAAAAPAAKHPMSPASWVWVIVGLAVFGIICLVGLFTTRMTEPPMVNIGGTQVPDAVFRSAVIDHQPIDYIDPRTGATIHFGPTRNDDHR